MHEGHRARLISKINDGAKLYEHEYLEALLFGACPRKDVNGVAHALIARFGSIGGVFSATPEELKEVEGVGGNIALYLAVIGSCLKDAAHCTSFACLRNTAEFRRFLTARAGLGDGLELFMLDAEGRVCRIVRFKDGDYDAFPSRRVIRALSAFRPYGIFAAIICEGRDSAPTEADDTAARELAEICRLGGVHFYDFCISGRDGIYSYFVNDRALGGRG